MTSNLTARLAAFTAGLRYEQLPGEAVHAIKRILLDCLGTSLAGSSLGAGVPQLLALVEQAGGAPEAAILGTSLRAPAHLAALANGGLAHALNYDDYLPVAGLHLGVTGVPAALAVADRTGGVSGKELITAIAAGCELMARLGLAIEKGSYTETRPQTSQMLGYFNAAASAGRVLRLSAAQMHSALGLALMQCSGGRQPVVEGAQAKALYAAWPNQTGVQSALLAKQGLDGVCAAFEGEAGLYATYFQGRYSAAALDQDLGEVYRLQGVTFKPWPTTNVAHVFIEAAISLMAEHNPRPPDIAAVHLRGQDHIRTFCEPAAVRQAPRTSVDAEDSIPFSVAKALANGRIGLADLQADGLKQPEALRIAAATTYSTDETLGTAGVAELTTTSGQRFAQRVDRPLGFPPRELSDDQLVAKFRDCAAHSVRPVEIDAAIGLVWNLERVDDVRRLTAALSSGNQ